jgi:poly-gamma-glutamate capsule biosynthesis protein CapA/YwtB (metallophosphatase superfamily)
VSEDRPLRRATSPVDILLFGDIILDVEDADHWLSGIAPLARSADLAIGHLEVPHTSRGEEMAGDVPAPGADPANLEALARAGFDAVTMAGNHIADCGAVGIADTIETLDRLGIAHCGAGPDLATATRPAFLGAGERQVALLSYNCVGPEIAWAAADRAGCAYVRVPPLSGGPTTPQVKLGEPDPGSLADMQRDIAAARNAAGLVIVALHKGTTHRPAHLDAYERTLAHAAIDAGADVVVGHHAHIAQGVELYRGKPIFHGLGNGCVVTRALSPDQDHPARAEWAQRRKAMFGFEPDPAYHLAPFHPEAVNAMAARIRWAADGGVTAGFVPLWIEAPGRPTVATGERAAEVADYIAQIGPRAGLDPVAWQGEDGWQRIP